MRIGRDHPLLLASASPRRRALLEAVGVPVVTLAGDVDESPIEGEGLDGYLERVVRAKLAVALAAVDAHRDAVALAADTVVVVDGEILGKPRDEVDARAMIGRLSGREHEVKTRFAVGIVGEPRERTARTVTTQVAFRTLDASTIAAYVASGEGADKAGAYAIQGVGSFAVRAIRGSYSNVVGLPVCEVVESLEELGLGRFPFVPWDPA